MLGTLARPRVFLPLVAGLVLFLAGLFFLRGPLEVPTLVIEPLADVGGYPLRNSVVSAWLALLILIGLSYFATRKMEMVPRGLQNFVEVVVEGFLNVVQTVAGLQNGRRFFPVVATIFLFVVVSNWLGLVPGMGTIGKVIPAEEVIHHAEEERLAELRKEHPNWTSEQLEKEAHAAALQSVKLLVMTEEGDIPLSLSYELDGKHQTSYEITATEWVEHHEELERQRLAAGHLLGYVRPANTDINTPAALAIISAIFVEFWGITSVGLFRYLGRFFNFRRLLRGDIFLGLIDAFVGGLELISETVRLISFTFRLFGNIFAGEVLILVFSFLLPLVFPVIFFGMELFFGMIQAFIFAMLTLVFGMMAVAVHGEGEHGEHASEGAHS